MLRANPRTKRIYTKVMWYFPVIPCLRHLFHNKEHAKIMKLHKEQRKLEAMLRHPIDGLKWQKVNITFLEFVEDTRNVWFGLSANSMNPLSEQSNGNSTWYVTLCMHNLLLWLCSKLKFIIMSSLIQGPKQPNNNIDVYLNNWQMNFYSCGPKVYVRGTIPKGVLLTYVLQYQFQ